MGRHLTRTTASRLVFAALLCGVAAVSVAAPADSGAASTKATLQLIGTRLRLASERTAHGRSVDPGEIEGYRRQLGPLLAAASQADDAALVAKATAIGRLIAQLEGMAARPQAAGAAAAAEPKPQPVDDQIVSRNHGDTCATAMGLSAAAPVRVVLGRAATAAAVAWLRVVPTDAAYRVIMTSSIAADPAVTVFAGCDATNALASNDDNVGLDAAVAVDNAIPVPLYVRLANDGDPGAVTLNVVDANTTISGKVTDAGTGTPIYQAHVDLFNEQGSYLWPDAYTDANGYYSVPAVSGAYYVGVEAPQHVGVIYPDAQCGFGNYYFSPLNCPSGQSQLVTVAGASVGGIDVALQTGHRIGGVVRDQDGNGLAGGVVRLYFYNGGLLASIYADQFGRYQFTALPAYGGYQVRAEASGYGSQWWDHVACSGPLQDNCTQNAGTLVILDDHDLATIDFNLPKLSAIEGNLLDQNSQPIPGYDSVTVLDSNGAQVSFTTADANGHFRSGWLPVGTYYAYAGAYGYFSQLFDGIDCAGSCAAQIGAATPIVITSYGQTKSAEFRLDSLPVVHGHVEDSLSSLPLSGVQVYASPTPPSTFNWVAMATTDSTGNYQLTGVLPGSYYLWAQSADHVDAIYPSVSCEAGLGQNPCDVTGATLLQIGLGQTPPAFDFALAPASSIGGKVVIDAGAGSDLPAVAEIDVFNGSGLLIASTTSDALGNYTVTDLAPGTVYAVGGGIYWYNYEFIGQVWSLSNCSGNCVPTTGTPIMVGPNSSVGGIDFRLVARRSVVGRLTDSFGMPIKGALVDLFDASDSGYRATGISDAAGYYAATYYTGSSYYVATDAAGYIDQAHSGIICPDGPAYFGLCPLDAATPISLDIQSLSPRIVNFSLTARELIFSNGFE